MNSQEKYSLAFVKVLWGQRVNFLRNFNKIVVKVEFVHVVYLRFYKTLKQAPPLGLDEKSLVGMVRGRIMAGVGI